MRSYNTWPFVTCLLLLSIFWGSSTLWHQFFIPFCGRILLHFQAAYTMLCLSTPQLVDRTLWFLYERPVGQRHAGAGEHAQLSLHICTPSCFDRHYLWTANAGHGVFYWNRILLILVMARLDILNQRRYSPAHNYSKLWLSFKSCPVRSVWSQRSRRNVLLILRNVKSTWANLYS